MGRVEQDASHGLGQGTRLRMIGGAILAVVLAFSLATAASADAATLKAPKKVKVGKRLTVKVRGFPANARIVIRASLHGPAAFSGRTLGRTRADASGKAKLRTRFPSTYKWCDADRRCKTFKWPKGAKIAISATATKPPHTQVRKIVRLKKGGKKPGGYRRCGGKVRLSGGDLARRIRAKGLGCRKAKHVIKAPAPELGYSCRTKSRNGIPRITCTKGRHGVRFDYLQS